MPYCFVFCRFRPKRLRGEEFPNDAELSINRQSGLINVIRRNNSQLSQYGFGVTMLRVVVEGIVNPVPPDIIWLLTECSDYHATMRLCQRCQEARICNALRLIPVPILFSARPHEVGDESRPDTENRSDGCNRESPQLHVRSIRFLLLGNQIESSAAVAGERSLGREPWMASCGTATKYSNPSNRGSAQHQPSWPFGRPV